MDTAALTRFSDARGCRAHLRWRTAFAVLRSLARAGSVVHEGKGPASLRDYTPTPERQPCTSPHSLEGTMLCASRTPCRRHARLRTRSCGARCLRPYISRARNSGLASSRRASSTRARQRRGKWHRQVVAGVRWRMGGCGVARHGRKVCRISSMGLCEAHDADRVFGPIPPGSAPGQGV